MAIQIPAQNLGPLDGPWLHFCGRAAMLEVRNLTAGYGDVTVLRDVTMSASTGSVVALLGPNGAGKTTLLRTISGLLKPTSGEIFLDGHSVAGLSAHQMSRRGACHIPEGRGIFPTLSVKENLNLFSPRGGAKATIERAADAFPILGNRLGQIAGSLSGGEQQMLALVRSYLSNPKVVLVDEASMGLAPVIVDRVFDFLEQVTREGVTLVIVEQYVNRALALASTVYLLNHGHIALTAKASEVTAEDIYERYLGVEV